MGDEAVTPLAAGATPASTTGETLVTRAELETWESRLAAKYNGELASLRKKLEGGKAVEAPKEGVTSSPVLTLEDLQRSREVGRLEVELGPKVIAALGEEYSSAHPAEQARMLRVASLARAADMEARGATPEKPQQSVRGVAPLPRDAVPRPRTMTEFRDLRKRDLRAANELINDPTFDLEALPFK